MKSRDFCYWLQGFFEVAQADIAERLTTDFRISPRQVACIQKHLAMVFKHEIDPSFPDNEELQKIHNSGSLSDIKLNC